MDSGILIPLVGAIIIVLNAVAAAIVATRGELLIDANIKLAVAKNGHSKIDGVLDDSPKATIIPAKD